MANRSGNFLIFVAVVLCSIAANFSSSADVPADTSAHAAQSPPDNSDITQEKLQAIEQEIAALRAKASSLTAQENSIVSLLAQFDIQAQMKTHEIELLELKQQKSEADIQALEKQFGQLDGNLKQQKSYLTSRLVEAYKQGQLNYLKLLLKVNSTADLLRSYQYITFLAKDDNRKVQEYRDSIKQLEQTRVQLQQENRNLVLLKQDLESAHAALLHSRQEKVQLLAAVQQQREMHLSALSDLSRAAGQLQSFFSNAPTDDSLSVPLTRFKGLLEWPVAGQIIHNFGIYKHPKFGTTTVNNGIEIAAPEGTGVHAVFDGRVVFSEWFKGYGECIILSHSDGFYTLYAHNSELLAKQGDAVQRGQIIAKVGSTGSLNGPTLYFEIRKKDQPLNPADWLRRLY
jgi:septal ring factor EnvC (AmiA/AmiB activator)